MRRALETALAAGASRRSRSPPRTPRSPPRRRGSTWSCSTAAGARNRRPRWRSTSSSTRSTSSSRRTGSTPSRSSRRRRLSPRPRISREPSRCSPATGAASVVSVVRVEAGLHPLKLKLLEGDRLAPYLEEDGLDALASFCPALDAERLGLRQPPRGARRGSPARRDGRAGVRDAGRALVRHRHAPRPRLRSISLRADS